MESNRIDNRGHTCRRPQRLKSLSESSTNDSGYSSEVFTSPEFTRSSQNLGITSESSVKDHLTFDGPATRTRLTSTPMNNSSSNKAQDINFPSPKLGAIKKSQVSNFDSAVAIVLPLGSDESEMEIISQDVQCSSSRNVINQKQSLSSRGRKCYVPTRTAVPGVSLSKPLVQAKKVQSVLIRLLKEADYLLYEVLKHLSSQDLIHVSQVNRQLRNIVLGSKELSHRKWAFITKSRKELERIGKENLKLKRLNEEAGTAYGRRSPRKQLGEVQNLPATSERKAPANLNCAPSLLSDKFIEEGQKLPQGEELQKCVKCKAPAKVHKPQLRAVCSSESCGYDYCMRCCLPSHRKAQDCSILKPRTRNGGGIFSKKCKKSLRRL